MPLRNFLAGILVVLVAVFASPETVEASALDELRAQGVIVERYDGLVELRTGDAPAQARTLVEQVNNERRALYEERAQAEDAPVEEVGKVYAEQIYRRAPSGTYFLQPDGSYVQK